MEPGAAIQAAGVQDPTENVQPQGMTTSTASPIHQSA